jgi:hypothetical protein
LILCLLVAACTGSGTSGSGSGNPNFFASDYADDFEHDNPDIDLTQRDNGNDYGLTPEQESRAALLVHELTTAEDRASRDSLIHDMVQLGPDYIPFFESIDHEAVILDLMYVVRRIKRNHNMDDDAVRNDNNQPTPTTQPTTEPPTDPSEEPEPRTIREPTVELPDEDDEFDREAIEKFLGIRLAQARRMLQTGRFDAARRVCESAITLLPDTRYRAEFDSLLLRARGESQSSLLLAGTLNLEPEVARYASARQGADFAEIVWIHCYLKNVSARPITLRLYEGEGRDSLLQLTVTYDQLDVQGNSMTVTGVVRLPITSDVGSIRVMPGDTYKLSIPLEGLSSLDPDAPVKPALGSAHIEAALRVYGAHDEEGETLVLRPVRFPTQRLLIFPSTFDVDEVSRRPLHHMRRNIEQNRAQPLFMAAHLVERRDLRRAGDLLMEGIDEDPLFMQRARMRTMHALFNVGSTWDAQRWHDWWQQNRLRY